MKGLSGSKVFDLLGHLALFKRSWSYIAIQIRVIRVNPRPDHPLKLLAAAEQNCHRSIIYQFHLHHAAKATAGNFG